MPAGNTALIAAARRHEQQQQQQRLGLAEVSFADGQDLGEAGSMDVLVPGACKT
jgi:hypothetical protein